MVHATVEFTREIANSGKVCLTFINSAPELLETVLSIREAGTEELDLVVETDIGVIEGRDMIVDLAPKLGDKSSRNRGSVLAKGS